MQLVCGVLVPMALIITQLFNYIDVSSEVFDSDGSEYNENTAFANGFDINWDGSRVIFGTRTFQIAGGELNKGDAIVWVDGEFELLCDYATGIQPFSKYEDGDEFVVFRREYIPELEYDGINIYAYSLVTELPILLLGGYDQFSTSHRVQMAYSGANAVILGGGGVPYTPPLTLVNTVYQYSVDIVSVDEVGIPTGGFRMSESMHPSITADGSRFCFVAPSIPSQIWIADLGLNGIGAEPEITNVVLDPPQVMYDLSTTSTFEAYITTFEDSIHHVAFNAFKDNQYQFRALTTNFPFMMLHDDGSFGDEYADDFTYTNNTVHTDLMDSPLGQYTIRIAASNSTLKGITAVDAEPFAIVDDLTAYPLIQGERIDAKFYKNSPNPVNNITTI